MTRQTGETAGVVHDTVSDGPDGGLDGVHPSPYAAVIEQAKGLIMGEYAVGAETAFEMIRKWSRDRNLKVRDVCAGLVAAAHLDSPGVEPVVAATSRATLEEATSALAETARRRRTNRVETAFDGVKPVIG